MKVEYTNNMEAFLWLIIEPYVHIELIADKLLLYNTIDGSIIDNDSNYIINKIFVNNQDHVYTIDKNLINNVDYNAFINKVLQKNMGIVIESKTKPIQMIPYVNLQIENIKPEEKYLVKDNSLLSLYEIDIYLNGDLCENNDFNKIAYKQIRCNYQSEIPSLNLDFVSLQKFILPILEYGNLKRINIMGGDITKYPYLRKLVDLVQLFNKEINLYVDLNCDIKIINEIRNSKLNHVSYCFFLKRDSPINEFKNFLSYFPQLDIMIDCIIESEDDFNYFEEIISTIEFSKVNYIPFYNGSNLSFFEKSVYIAKEDIFNSKKEKIELYRNQKLNIIEYGKLIIMNNGEVFGNINEDPIGRIKVSSIKEIIFSQLLPNSVWFKTRNKVEPCMDCVYNAFCPAISNYNYALKKHNLCTVL